MTLECVPGLLSPLGATWDGEATNLAVISNAAEYGGMVSACVLDDAGSDESVALYPTLDGVWHGRVTGLAPGQSYGFRASGAYDPSRGVFFDPSVLLCDPYARAFTPNPAGGPRSRLSVVVSDTFDWGADAPPRTPVADTVVYETHVRGLTMQHPGVDPALRGTFAALGSAPIVDYLTGLGVTAVELMPVHEFVSEQFLLDRGLRDYWGYSTLGYFAPHSAYSSAGTRGAQVDEFRAMVKSLHAAGLEVILDVVFNHTAEGSPDQPALSWRGLANSIYYRLDPDDPSRYDDTTGTGNSLDAGSPEVLRLIADSLRYWVQVMHVDGFRFDLAAELMREGGVVDRSASFLDILYEDPVISTVKLIAEPWDVNAPDSYEVGHFPAQWSEWNDHARDTVRHFWLQNGGVGDLATRLAGSSDLYGTGTRGPTASVNYVASHDGSTTNDLVTYQQKVNQANGDDNTDGPSYEFANNHGVEGPTDDPAIGAARAQDIRNMLLTLLVSQGMPMLLGGDERRRTQLGNNNAYCQDNATSWYDWTVSDAANAMTSFVTKAIALRRDHCALRRQTFLSGSGSPLADVTWFGADGGEAWDSGTQFLGFLLAGDASGRIDATGAPIVDDDIAVLVNAGAPDVTVALPGRVGASYQVVLTTATEDGTPTDTAIVGQSVVVGARTVTVLTSPRSGGSGGGAG